MTRSAPTPRDSLFEVAASSRSEPASDRRAARRAARRRELRAIVREVLPWVAGLALTLAWDRAVYLHLSAHDTDGRARLESYQVYWMFRTLGDLRFWIPVSIVFIVIDASRIRYPLKAVLRRGVFVSLCAALSGAAAELLKPLIGRYKPENTDGWMSLAPWRDRLSEWHDLGMASSHTAVAFGAAFALSRIYKAPTPLFVAAAVGCAMTRILSGGHFLSDVYVAVTLGYVVSSLIAAIDLRNNRGNPIDRIGADPFVRA